MSAGGAATGMTLKCIMDIPEAVGAYPTHQAKLTAMHSSQEGRFLVQGFTDGIVRVMQSPSGSSNTLGEST